MEDLVIEEEGASSALKITLGDFLVFINWMNQTEKALERGEALPTTPDLDSGKVKGWIQLVQRLEERFRRSEEKKLALEANVIAQEAQLGQLRRSTRILDRPRRLKKFVGGPRRYTPPDGSLRVSRSTVSQSLRFF